MNITRLVLGALYLNSLPITFSHTDYHSIEKVYDLGKILFEILVGISFLGTPDLTKVILQNVCQRWRKTILDQFV